jgi:hypothetical protein
MPPLDINLSSTALSWSACMRNLKLHVIDGYKPESVDAKIIYGVALHKYFDTMYKTQGHIPTARAKAIESFNVPKDIDKRSQHMADQNHMLTTAFNYFETVLRPDKEFELIDFNGTPASEFTFKILIYEDSFVRIWLCGTIDGIGKIAGGVYAVRDFKSTQSWSPNEYFSTYEMSCQLRVYLMVIKLMSIIEPNSILGQIGKTKMGAFIDGLFIKPAASDNQYKRSELFQFSDKELSDFRFNLDNLCKRISFHVKEQYYPKEGLINGSCQGKWGKCHFWVVCKVEDEVGNVLLKRDFKQKLFDPLHYSD